MGRNWCDKFSSREREREKHTNNTNSRQTIKQQSAIHRIENKQSYSEAAFSTARSRGDAPSQNVLVVRILRFLHSFRGERTFHVPSSGIFIAREHKMKYPIKQCLAMGRLAQHSSRKETFASIYCLHLSNANANQQWKTVINNISAKYIQCEFHELIVFAYYVRRWCVIQCGWSSVVAIDL